MSLAAVAVDLVTVGLLVSLAVRIVITGDFFEAVVLLIAFGLLMSLAWVRLGATDLALAEAALGAGVTGALFLNALRRLAAREAPSQDEPQPASTTVPEVEP